VSSALGTALPSAIVIVVYVLIGIVAFWPVDPGISQHVFSDGGDYVQSVWFLNWVPYAIAHGLNPFFSNGLLVPQGVNLAQNTASPLLGLASAPFSFLFGPVVSTNLLMLLGMPVSATAAFVVLRRWHVWLPGAALGGLIYGFSPYMVGQSLDHLGLIFLPLPPLIAMTVASIVRRTGSSWRLGVQLGLLTAAQFLISQEILVVVAILAILGLACVAVQQRANLPEFARSLVRPIGVALAITAVLVVYPVWMMVAGPQHFTGALWPTTNVYHNDLLSFVVPGPLQRVPLGMRALGTRLDPSIVALEIGGYIGVPLLILLGFFAWRSRRSSRMQLAVVLLLGAALLSLGPHLAVDGHVTGLPLPFLLVDHIPLLNDILPSRIDFALSACVGAVVAFGLDDLRRAEARADRHASAQRLRLLGGRSSIIAAVTLAILVATQLPQWPPQQPFAAQPNTALPARIGRAIPNGDPVAITYPYATSANAQPMLWQA
jgi:hypothetical protein